MYDTIPSLGAYAKTVPSLLFQASMRMWCSRSFTLLLLCMLGLQVQAFGPFATTTTKATTPVQVDAAVALYQKKYPPNRAPRRRAFNAGVGMPVRDIDGTKFNVAKDSTMGKVFSDRSETDLKATYTALAKYFGNEDALQMVKDFTLVLAMNRNNLVPIMAAYGETFGADKAKEMVKRNPGLLFCSPSDAADADDLTMQFSYVVAATRPVGPILLYGLLALLFEPTFELVSGIPLKSMIFSSAAF